MEVEHVFKAVADQYRRRLLDSLAKSNGQTLTELCAGMPMSRIGVMKHLDILEEAGLITTRKIGRERFHFLNAGPLQSVDSWLHNYRWLFNERMDRMEELIERTLAEKQKQEKNDAQA